jgi:hypothetical protein
VIGSEPIGVWGDHLDGDYSFIGPDGWPCTSDDLVDMALDAAEHNEEVGPIIDIHSHAWLLDVAGKELSGKSSEI